MSIRIDRCVCVNRTFASLWSLAQAQKLTLEELSACTGAGAQCSSCLPYLKRMYETGQTVFTEIIEPDALARDAQRPSPGR